MFIEFSWQSFYKWNESYRRRKQQRQHMHKTGSEVELGKKGDVGGRF